MPELTQGTMQDKLEDIVDEYGLEQVLDWLQRIAQDKVEHLRTNWQDYNAADIWEAKAELIYSTIEELGRI